MIQMQTNLTVADNSGAKTVQCIKVVTNAVFILSPLYSAV